MPFDIPFIKPVMPPPEEVAADVSQIVSSNWYTNFGPFERRFREQIAAYVGEVSAATFSNATIGLQAALTVMLAGKPAGLVIVPSFTFAAGPHAIRSAGHQPLFIDIDPATLQPSAAHARSALNDYGDQVSAILLCNTFGIGTSVAEWEAMAQDAGIPLIIDSAAGFGSRYPDGHRLGARGDCEVFSFHATKPFAIGEGGALFSRDAEIATRAREFSNFGFSGLQGATAAGTNGKLQEINAAIGIRQLSRFDAVIESRRGVLESYRQVLESTGAGGLVPNADQSSVCFASVVFVDRDTRDHVVTSLRDQGIEARVYYAPPVHEQPTFADAAIAGDLHGTALISSRIACLPVYEDLPARALSALELATLKQ